MQPGTAFIVVIIRFNWWYIFLIAVHFFSAMQDVDNAVADYSFLQTRVNTTIDNATNTLQSAQVLQNQAEMINATANAVTLQQLNGK